MLAIDGRWEVVSRVRGKKQRARLVLALARQRRKPIRKRVVRGSRRRKAIEKGLRKLARRSSSARVLAARKWK
jgi:hypothetical protein